MGVGGRTGSLERIESKPWAGRRLPFTSWRNFTATVLHCCTMHMKSLLLMAWALSIHLSGGWLVAQHSQYDFVLVFGTNQMGSILNFALLVRPLLPATPHCPRPPNNQTTGPDFAVPRYGMIYSVDKFTPDGVR